MLAVQNIIWNLKLYSFAYLNIDLEHLQISTCESPQIPTGYTLFARRESQFWFMQFVLWNLLYNIVDPYVL